MLIKILKKYASGKVCLYSFLFSMSVYLLMILYSIPLVSKYAPEMMLFDVSPTGYTYDYAVSLLSQLGAEGRGLYLSLQLPLDLVYPISFGISHALIICWLFDKTGATSPLAPYACLLPVAGCLLDYSENIAIFSMLINYPRIAESVVQLSSILTISKSVFVTITYLFICVLLLVTAARKMKAKKNEPA